MTSKLTVTNKKRAKWDKTTKKNSFSTDLNPASYFTFTTEKPLYV